MRSSACHAMSVRLLLIVLASMAFSASSGMTLNEVAEAMQKSPAAAAG